MKLLIASPLLLALAPAAIVLAYLLRRLRDRPLALTVGSLLIWERVPAALLEAEPRRRAARRSLDLRFACEAAALALLAIAASGPAIVRSPARRDVAIFVDTSPSMLAPAAGGGTRLASAREAAETLRKRLRPQDLLQRATFDSPRELLDFALSRATRGTGVHVFTDGPLEGATPIPAGLETVYPAAPGGLNVAIVAAGARLVQGGGDGGGPASVEVFAAVQAFGGDRGGLPSRVALEAGGRRVEVAVPGTVVFRLDPGWDPSRSILLGLGGLDGDSLADDDSVLLVPPAPSPLRVGVAAAAWAPRDPLRTALAGADPEVEVVEVAAAVDARARPGGGSGAGAQAIEIAPDLDVLVIVDATGAGSGPAPERSIPEPSPLVRHADLAAALPKVAPAPAPEGFRPLARDERGRPLVGYREEPGGRLAVWVGFPLSDATTDWTKDASFPIFFAEVVAAARDAGRGASGRAAARGGAGAFAAEGVLDARESAEAAAETPARPLGADAPDPAVAAAAASAPSPRPSPWGEAVESGGANAVRRHWTAPLLSAAALVLAGAAAAGSWALARERRLEAPR